MTLYCNHQSEKSMNKEGCFLNQDILVLTFHVNLKTTVPFVTTRHEIFHCTHHLVIPKSDLYFTFCSTLNALSKATITRCDLSPGFFCTDAKLLCEFESDKIWINEFI